MIRGAVRVLHVRFRGRLATSVVAMSLGLALAVMACGPVTPSIAPSDAAVVVTPTAPPPTTTVEPTALVAIDATLLQVLPATVDSLDVVESPEAETAALAVPELGKVGSAMAAGLAIDGPTGQFVYAVVIRLRPGALNDQVFRDWRDTFDQGACSQSSGVAGNAQAEIGGHTVYIGTCTGGLRTYHLWLNAQGLLISASSVGDSRLGELLMQNLRP